MHLEGREMRIQLKTTPATVDAVTHNALSQVKKIRGINHNAANKAKML